MSKMNNTTNPGQFLLPLDFAPDPVRRHGLQDAPALPFVSRGKAPGGAFPSSFQVHASQAWTYPSVEYRTDRACTCLILDIDGHDSAERLNYLVRCGDLPMPNWQVTRDRSGGTHAFWCLARPVLDGRAGLRIRRRPLRFLARVSEYFAERCEADRGYTGVLAHNPVYGEGFSTQWGRESPYELDGLSAVIPDGWRMPSRQAVRTSAGRNCALFEAGCRWAGRRENEGADVSTYLTLLNVDYSGHPLGLLPGNEVEGIARSVERYRTGWEYITPRFSARQAWKGQRSGISRRAKTAERDAAIIQAVNAGESMRAMARMTGLRLSTIQNIVSRVTDEPTQL